MVDTIYVEEEVLEHPRAKLIISKFPLARIIEIDRFGEVFNKRNQNFKIQKINPAIILAKKYKKLILPAPDGFGIGDLIRRRNGRADHLRHFHICSAGRHNKNEFRHQYDANDAANWQVMQEPGP